MSSSQKKFALVKWASGDDEGTFSHDVPISWIRDFSEEADFKEESWLVEWRVPPKPTKGWDVYDAVVLAVHDDLKVLKELKKREAELSDLREKARQTETPHRRSSTSRDNTSKKDLPSGSHDSPSPSTPKVDTPQNVHSFLSQLLAAATQAGSPLSSPGGDSLRQSKSHTEESVKIGKSLSVAKSCYLEARAARTGSAMTKILVKGAFSIKRLKRSSYAGQKRGDDQKPSLRKYMKMQDIQNFVLTRFENFSQSNFSSAVNSCTGKKAERRKKMKLVEESEESANEESMEEDHDS